MDRTLKVRIRRMNECYEEAKKIVVAKAFEAYTTEGREIATALVAVALFRGKIDD